jgi:hypothetical protein
MEKKLLTLLIIIISLGNPSVAQKVLNLPECCIDEFKHLDVRQPLQSTRLKKNTPWVVYSERGKDFGQQYYVVKESGEEILLYTGDGLNGDELKNGTQIGWRRKVDLLVHFSSELHPNAIIHKKCVILNKQEALDDILAGRLDEANIPLYISPYATESFDSIPLYFMYFIYKSEGSRFLIGRDYRYDEKMNFKDQIFGWVEKSRVYEYNTRICFEPNYERQAIAERRCNPALSAKVYEYWDPDKEIFVGDVVWEEPDHWYLFNSDGITDSSEIQNKISKLCLSPKKPDFSLFEVEYLPGIKFRFPLIKAKTENIFFLGCAGRYDEGKMVIEEKCRKLEENKKKLNISLIIDQELKITKAVNFLEKIDSKGKEFTKQYSVCMFPRPDFGEPRQAINSSYSITRDKIKAYTPGTNLLQGDNCLNTLDFILNKENELDPLETNVFILLNMSNVPQNSETSELYKRLKNNIESKNCYIIVFDYLETSNLIPQLKDLMLKAGNSYAYKHGISAKPSFSFQNNIYTLGNSGILAVMMAGKANSEVVSQVESFVPVAFEDILNTVEDAIAFNCSKNTGTSQKRESPFSKVISDFQQESVILSVRAMQEGYSLLRFKDDRNCSHDMWKAEVLMTRTELTRLIDVMEKYAKVSVNKQEQANNIAGLWRELANRFVGDNIDEKDLLDRTPKELLQAMVGGYFGYSEKGVLKNYTLRQILNRDQDAVVYFDQYSTDVNKRFKELKLMRDNNFLEFKNIKDGGEEKSNISYFWVPIDKLP